MIMAAPGSRSEGLKTRVFPVTAAIGIVHRGIILREMSNEALHEKKYYVRRKVEWRNTVMHDTNARTSQVTRH